MKKSFLLYLLFCITKAHSQDIAKIQQIDSLVTITNFSKLKIERDTISQDQPALGLSMKTYLTMGSDSFEVKKYINRVNAIRKENGIAKEITSVNAFYFNNNALIKVEEFIIEEDEQLVANWYYSGDKPLYYTVRSDKSPGRAEQLLEMSKFMLKQLRQQK